FIERCHFSDCVVEHAHCRTEQIAKDPGHGHHDINPRPAQLFERDNVDIGGAIHRLPARSYSKEPQHLREGLALCLDVIDSPEDHRYSFRISSSFFEMALEQRVSYGLRSPYRHSRWN